MDQNSNKAIGKYATCLSLVEIGLGSFLHGFKIPLSGHLLSLNQGFILTRATVELKNPKAPSYISTTSALLKSLSPAGKKLTPMLAISTQGQLYSFGLMILGNNILGQILGMGLLTLWSFIQPLCIYLLLFGKDLIYMLEYYIDKLAAITPVNEKNLLMVLGLLIVFKIIIGISLVILANKISVETFTKYIRWAEKHKQNKKSKKQISNPYIGAGKDLFNPLFLLTWVLTLIFFIFAKNDSSEIIWLSLRPIAMGYLVFLFFRAFPVQKIAKRWIGKERQEVLEKTLESFK